MRFFGVAVLLSLASVLKGLTPKHCINCRYFIDSQPESRNGKCSFFPYKNVNYLVSGKESDKEYYFAISARNYEHLCGEEGKHYKEKYEPKEEHSY